MPSLSFSVSLIPPNLHQQEEGCESCKVYQKVGMFSNAAAEDTG